MKTQVKTWQSPRGHEVSLCLRHEDEARQKNTWPRDPVDGQECCQVSHGLHTGTCDRCDDEDYPPHRRPGRQGETIMTYARQIRDLASRLWDLDVRGKIWVQTQGRHPTPSLSLTLGVAGVIDNQTDIYMNHGQPADLLLAIDDPAGGRLSLRLACLAFPWPD